MTDPQIIRLIAKAERALGRARRLAAEKNDDWQSSIATRQKDVGQLHDMLCRHREAAE